MNDWAEYAREVSAAYEADQEFRRVRPLPDDITYYVDPGPVWEPPEFLTTPGVSSAWFLLDGEYLPVAIVTMGDGKGSAMRRDL